MIGQVTVYITSIQAVNLRGFHDWPSTSIQAVNLRGFHDWPSNSIYYQHPGCESKGVP